MAWLQTLDVDLFRFLNLTLNNPFFDVMMPWFSGNVLFLPVLLGAAVLLIWKGGARGRLLVFMLLVILPLGDGLICNTIKHAVARPRPFMSIADAHLLLGKGPSFSMPSAHAANWAAAAFIAFVYYRRSVWFMLPLAGIVGFSRIYNGVHYPSDVLAGFILGGGYAAGSVWALNALWQKWGRRWFPLWWAELPSLLSPKSQDSHPSTRAQPRELQGEPAGSPTIDTHWLRLGYLVIGVLLAARLAYIASDTIELSGDEAYQWLWSKHLALSYYSKPLLIACTQFLGTSLWGESAFGVRFFSPIIAALLSLLLLRFFAREANARAGFFLLLIVTATLLMAVGATLMTVDPLSVLFWTLAMLAGWRAIRDDATTRDWLWVGLWTGLGFLSKYTALFQWLSWAVLFCLWPPARKQLRRPGPYLALLVCALCALPVLIWNAQHDWITVQHVANDNAKLDKPWHPTLKYLLEFLGGEFCLLNPVFFVATGIAAIGFWRERPRDLRLVYFFSMGAPLFLVYLLFTLHSRVQLNWIAPSVLPLFCLMVLYWDAIWQRRGRQVKVWFAAGLSLGLAAVVLLHDTDLIGKFSGYFLPSDKDPLRRVRAWAETARLVGEARKTLLAEGKPVFIVGAHYGITSQIAFHLPEAKAVMHDNPLVFYLCTDQPVNQFYFWPCYRERKGDNAIFVQELDLRNPEPIPPPTELDKEFASVTRLGIFEARYRGRVMRHIQLFACRDLL
jgi:membrane-associated phospholipid phosphatase